MYRIAVVAHQMVPVRQLLSFGQQTVAAGFWKPAVIADRLWCQLDAVRDTQAAVSVVAATTGLGIEQTAGHVRVVDAFGVLVLEFLQAAQAAAIAHGFPLRTAHALQRSGLPERCSGSVHCGSAGCGQCGAC